MSNPIRGEVEIELGGQTRVLRFDMNALCELEARLQMPIGKIFDSSFMGIRVIREALHVGLTAKGDRRLTVKMVGDWMTSDQLEYLGEKLGEALKFALGVDEKELEDPHPLVVASNARSDLTGAS